MADNPRAPQSAPTSEEKPPAAPAQITLVYESRDKRFCLFEDAEGHLTAVRASRLA